MAENQTRTEAILAKMEELYNIRFNPYIYICLEDSEWPNTYYYLLDGSSIKRKYKYRVALNSIEFESIFDLFEVTQTAEQSCFNKLNISCLETIRYTPIFCFEYSGNTIFIDAQNVMFQHMLNYTKVQLWGDERQKDYMEEFGGYEYQCQIIDEFC